MELQEICNELGNIYIDAQDKPKTAIEEASRLQRIIRKTDPMSFDKELLISTIRSKTLLKVVIPTQNNCERSIRDILSSSGNKVEEKMRAKKEFIGQLEDAKRHLETVTETISNTLNQVKIEIVDATKEICGPGYTIGISRIGEWATKSTKLSEETRQQLEDLLYEILWSGSK